MPRYIYLCSPYLRTANWLVSSFARIRCPSVGNQGDLQLAINIKVTSTEPLSASPLVVGTLDYDEFAGQDATLQDITLDFLGNEPCEEALDAVAFQSGSIRFVTLLAHCPEGSEASILQCVSPSLPQKWATDTPRSDIIDVCILHRGIATSDSSFVFASALGLQQPWTVARIREVCGRIGVQVTGFDTSIDSDDLAVVGPMLSEM
jgi:hypothetical protein